MMLYGCDVAEVGERAAGIRVVADELAVRRGVPAVTIAPPPSTDRDREGHDRGDCGNRRRVGDQGRKRLLQRPHDRDALGELACVGNRILDPCDARVDTSGDGTGNSRALGRSVGISKEEELDRIEVRVPDDPPDRKGAFGLVDGRRAAVDFPEGLFERHGALGTGLLLRRRAYRRGNPREQRLFRASAAVRHGRQSAGRRA